MKKLTFLIIALLCCLGVDVYAQSADSVALDEVVITSSNAELETRKLPMTVSVIDKEQIENRLEQSLLPVISEAVPSLFITSRGIMGYGVANGSAGGMKMRGIGGSPTVGILMLIDGHPQYMGLMGHPLADSYQSMMAERVEVVSGPASVLYGSNASGGAINIITARQKKDGINTNLKTMYGSYNTSSSEIANTIKKGKFNSYISLNYNHSDGHRRDMDFEQYSSYAKIGYEFSRNWDAFADMNLTQFDASNPGSISAPIIDNDADVKRGVTSFSLNNKYDKTSGSLKFFYNFGEHKINDGYSESGQPKDYRFNSKDKMMGISVFQTYNLFEGNRISKGFDYQHFGGRAWNRFEDDRPDAGIVNKTINDVAAYVNVQQDLNDKLMFNVGFRIDHNSHTGTEWIPQVGLNYAASSATSLRANVGKGFRNPTIREMYMFPPQNPDLQAERLVNYELSVNQYLLDKDLSVGMNVFYIDGENGIQTIMQEGKPLNVNTGKIENYGLELLSSYRVNPNLSFNANYSWLHMKYKVEAAPKHKVHFGANYTKNKWQISSGLQYVGCLYTAVGATETSESFTLWNVRLIYSPIKRIDLYVKGENLLAQKYEVNLGYPMPRTTIFGGIKLKI